MMRRTESLPLAEVSPGAKAPVEASPLALAATGRDMLIYGSASIVHTLTNYGLIDEYQILVHPVILGGKPLFQDVLQKQKLKLVKTKSFLSGVIGLHYQPDNQ